LCSIFSLAGASTMVASFDASAPFHHTPTLESIDQ
jgi:hypothetical protein